MATADDDDDDTGDGVMGIEGVGRWREALFSCCSCATDVGVAIIC